MAYTDIAIQQAIITEALVALGYNEQAGKFVKIVNHEVAYCFKNVPGQGWEYELLSICKQPTEYLGTWEEDAYKVILDKAIELDRSNVSTESYEEGAEDAKWAAQRDFEQAYWDHMDGAESDFDPAIYGERED